MSARGTSQSRGRTWRNVGLGALTGMLVVLASLAGLRWLLLRDTSSPVSVADAVSGFRATKPSGRAPSRNTPSPGVYVARTKGSELLDVQGGARHRYPSRTALVVERNGCGFAERWMPLDGRQRDTLLCRTEDGWAARTAEDVRTFFRFVEFRRDYTCASPPLELPAQARRGQRWRSRCSGAGTVSFGVEGSSTVLGRESIPIAGTPVSALHVRTQLAFSGGIAGTAVRETWRRPTDGLLIKESYREDTALVGTPHGDVAYRDRFELQLESLRPRR
jgi:hypothetical protein